MFILRVLLLPVSVPSWLGRRASDALASAVDGVVRTGSRVATRLGLGGRKRGGA